jgi:hypothetical protein
MLLLWYVPDLIRREEDILHINKQITEVNAAFKEVDQLVTDQGEVVGEFLLCLCLQMLRLMAVVDTVHRSLGGPQSKSMMTRSWHVTTRKEHSRKCARPT